MHLLDPKPNHPLPGDRAPDFWLPKPGGEVARFYDRFLGNGLVLLFPGGDRGELDELIARAEAFTALGAKRVAVCRETPADLSIEEDATLDFTLFTDPAGKITEGYGAAAADGGRLCLVLDGNQRVLFADAGGRDLAAKALSYLESHPLERSEGRVMRQAPALIVPRVLEPEICAELIADWAEDNAEGLVRARGAAAEDDGTRVVDHSSKKRLDHRLGEAKNRALSQLVMRRIRPELQRAYQFDAHALERFCVGAYDAERGDYFRPHRDNSTAQTQGRRFALTLNLNEDFEGGGLRFPEFGDQVYQTEPGGAVIFSCSLLHEAVPVNEGRRYVALSFIHGRQDMENKRRGGLPPGLQRPGGAPPRG